MSFLTIGRTGASASGLTNIYTVSCGLQDIGYVKWYAHWRRYVLSPNMHTIWDAACLEEVAEFCKRETLAHKGQS